MGGFGRGWEGVGQRRREPTAEGAVSWLGGGPGLNTAATCTRCFQQQGWSQPAKRTSVKMKMPG